MFANRDFLKDLKAFEIPTCLRVCAGTDGSVTFLLEIMTRHEVEVITEDQHLVKADEEMAGLLDVDVGEEVNNRTVRLVADGVPYVHAVSLSPIGRMPEEVRRDMMRADIPIGKILRNYGMETRRDLDTIQMEADDPLFGSRECLSRTYRIVHHNDTLMWIKERFPADGRWLL
ncbi:MAG: hypothetical protein AWU58_1548 [Methanohalophilus sp. T328-1]|uniref:chorismate--pyruvate lyase family protein n=1 Tax=Methanohalophilus sp. DAL1 TaxID=1864608 RepID=UPI00079B4002|nr:chorismate pyruvate-lyase family protein [Methanohalophilus sp. DAL1]KXS42171.1 MAG: hypothetical protein AWU58_1548 [Methanohalophilus sp. T328-1]